MSQVCWTLAHSCARTLWRSQGCNLCQLRSAQMQVIEIAETNLGVELRKWLLAANQNVATFRSGWYHYDR